MESNKVYIPRNTSFEMDKENSMDLASKRMHGGDRNRHRSNTKSNTAQAKVYNKTSLESRNNNKYDFKRHEKENQHATMSDDTLLLFRTKLCRAHQSQQCKNADKCPHSHCLTWQRRNPSVTWYSQKLCPEIQFSKKGSKMTLIRRCTKGRACTYAHSKEEELYHPQMYKTKMCSAYPNCTRYYCPFAHSTEELRDTTKNATKSHKTSHVTQDSLKENIEPEIKIITPNASTRMPRSLMKNLVPDEVVEKPTNSAKRTDRLRPPSAATTACCSHNVSPLISWSPLLTDSSDFRASPMPDFYLDSTPVLSPAEHDLHRAVDILAGLAQLEINEPQCQKESLNAPAELLSSLSDEIESDEGSLTQANPSNCGPPGLCRQLPEYNEFNHIWAKAHDGEWEPKSIENEEYNQGLTKLWIAQQIAHQQFNESLSELDTLGNDCLLTNFEDIDYEEIWNDIANALVTTL